MKKTSKMFGAVAISAALAMGAVPAFAATQTDGTAATSDETNDFAHETLSTAGASTDVNVFYNADQIQATVPLEITIVATGNDVTAGAIVAPTNYRIENNSTTKDIKVTNVAASEKQGTSKALWMLFDFGSTAPMGNNIGEKGALDLDLTPGEADAAKVSMTDAKVGSGVAVTDAAWKVEKKTTEPGELLLNLSGESYVAAGILSGNGGATSDATDAAFTITYTVAIA